ncbi:hypothetical protein Nos7524_0831 [Nostoc sp. PCC 7524]|uniref:hypothetical protein n=1 Tax=Nostoc sp. (strain ATCC 29411 / PCC 7524) TaxID=28072 RepID=UPI00029EDDD5|nr:hypothetical protein [Nostoc sp. PCC 7524]AFY46734.1 hypothetical protein Nos7524_0831 [Nostoc sp. PCC 7524]
MNDIEQLKLDYENAKSIRSMIEHENNLQNYRLTWLMTIQGLLFTGLGFAWDKKDAMGLVTIFCLVGILVAISTWSALKLSDSALENLVKWWENNKSEQYTGSPIIGLYNRKLTVLRPWVALPWIFIGAWLVILFQNLMRQ